MTTKLQNHKYRWVGMIFLSISLLVISLDNTVLNVALPTISRDLGASASELQWISEESSQAGVPRQVSRRRRGRERMLWGFGVALLFVSLVLIAAAFLFWRAGRWLNEDLAFVRRATERESARGTVAES